jgi:hypothetical protein
MADRAIGDRDGSLPMPLRQPKTGGLQIIELKAVGHVGDQVSLPVILRRAKARLKHNWQNCQCRAAHGPLVCGERDRDSVFFEPHPKRQIDVTRMLVSPPVGSSIQKRDIVDRTVARQRYDED